MLIKVIVIPESSQEYVREIALGQYEVAVCAAAQHGHANRLASYLLAKHFSASATLVSGGTRTHKIFKIGR